MSARHGTNWKLAVQVAPLVAVALVAKLVAHLLDVETIELNPLHSGLVAANVFLLGFLLAGTLADYKESEKLPAELAGRTETIADECQILYREQGADAARRCIEHLAALTDTLSSWLHGRGAVRDVLGRIEELNQYFLEFQPLTQPNFIVRLKQEQNAIRRMVLRIQTIRDTSFVGAGYAIAEMATLLLVIGLLLVDVGTFFDAIFLLCIITFLLVYMIFLIRDLDNPFDYKGGKAGTAEVSIRPIEELQKRLEQQLAEIETTPAAASA